MNRVILAALMTAALVGCRPDADVTVSTDGEVKSLAHALGKIREMRARGEMPREKVARVAVGPGRYHVAETIVMTPEDSNVRIVGAGYGKSVIDGGVEIGRFTDKGGIWEAEVPAGLRFEQLWVNDRRAQRARTPNGGEFLYMREPDDKQPCAAFYGRVQDVECLAKLSAEELDRAFIVYWQSWCMGFAKVKAADGKTGKVVTNRPKCRYGYFFWDKTCPRYAIENCRAALDAPGEWFLDEKASKLMYIPREGERVETAKAYVPALETLVKLEGNAAKGEYVRNVTFEGLGMEFSKFDILPNGIPSAQAASNVGTALFMAYGAEGLEMRNCRVAHTGGHGVWLRGGTRKSRIVHTLVEDLGAGGVYFGEMRKNLKNIEMNSPFLKLEDSIVRHGGRILEGAIGVWLGNVRDCEVVHNEICDFRYTGVSLGWTWGYDETPTRRNHVGFNHIHHIQQGRLSDGGGFYSLGNQEGSTVCNNWVHDVNGYRDNGSPAFGLYTDEGSANILLASNLVERCRACAIHQHYGKENTYANNILVTFDDVGAWRSREESHVTMRVDNNIFWWKEPSAMTYRTGGQGRPIADMPVDGNIYWCATGKMGEKAFNGLSFEEWRKSGKDANGAIADPMFVDAENGDWRLKPESPALKAGFKPFDWKAAGVYKGDAEWAKKAAERTWDEFRDAAKAPEFFRKKVSFDCEGLIVGEVRNAMDGLAPLRATPGMPGGIAVVGDDAAEGKRALELKEIPGNKAAFMPMVEFKCRVVEGTVKLNFSVMPFERSSVSAECRDYDSSKRKGAFVSGPRVTFKNGKVYASGKAICESGYGKWVDVELTMCFSGEKRGKWTCKAATRGGQSGEKSFEGFGDELFKRLTWVGFISYGEEGSKWRLDDIRMMPAGE